MFSSKGASAIWALNMDKDNFPLILFLNETMFSTFNASCHNGLLDAQCTVVLRKYCAYKIQKKKNFTKQTSSRIVLIDAVHWTEYQKLVLVQCTLEYPFG